MTRKNAIARTIKRFELDRDSDESRSSSCEPTFDGHPVNDELSTDPETVSLALAQESPSTRLTNCHRGFDLEFTVNACDRNGIAADVTIVNALSPTHR